MNDDTEVNLPRTKTAFCALATAWIIFIYAVYYASIFRHPFVQTQLGFILKLWK